VRRALRALLERPAVERVVATIKRATAVRETGRFLARELSGRRVVADYRVRGLPARIALRHRSTDVVTLDELFYTRDYEPPARAVAELGVAPRIIDLGANAGYFGALARARWPGAELTAFEPDPANVAILRRTAALNGGGWEIIEAAAARAPGVVRFLAGAGSLSRVADAAIAGVSGREIEAQAVDVLPLLAAADLAKIDIEGAEWALLGDPRLRQAPPRVLVLEYHPVLCPGGDPHATVRELLGAAGMEVTTVWRREDGHGMVWAWRA
jgi:FkbM family methyltransferase